MIKATNINDNQQYTIEKDVKGLFLVKSLEDGFRSFMTKEYIIANFIITELY